MSLIGYLDGGQLAIQVVGVAVAAALGVAAFARYRGAMQEAQDHPEEVIASIRSGHMDESCRFTSGLAIMAVCCLLALGVILPFAGHQSRNRNAHERDTVVAHAEFYGYGAIDIHPNSDEFTADFGDCELPARYWRHDDQVIGTELILPDMQIYSLQPPPTWSFLQPYDVTFYPEVMYYCNLQDGVERVISD